MSVIFSDLAKCLLSSCLTHFSRLEPSIVIVLYHNGIDHHLLYGDEGHNFKMAKDAEYGSFIAKIDDPEKKSKEEGTYQESI